MQGVPPNRLRLTASYCFKIVTSIDHFAIDRFGNVYKFMHISSEHLVTSYSINLLFINEPQCLESSLHTLLVAMSGKASGKLSGCQEQPLFERYA